MSDHAEKRQQEDGGSFEDERDIKLAEICDGGDVRPPLESRTALILLLPIPTIQVKLQLPDEQGKSY